MFDEAKRAESPKPAVESDSQNPLAAFLQCAVYSGVEEPIRGVAQIVNPDADAGIKNAFKTIGVERPASTDFGSVNWHAQQLGSALGMMVPYMLTRCAVTKIGGRVLGAEAMKVNPLTPSESRAKLFSRAGKEAGISSVTGFANGTLLRPAEKNDGNPLAERLTNGRNDAINFGAIGFVNPLMSRTFSSAGAAAERSIAIPEPFRRPTSALLRGPVLPGAASGLPAGAISAEVTALQEGRSLATPIEFAESMYGNTFVGGAFGTAHWLAARKGKSSVAPESHAKGTETPIERQQDAGPESRPQAAPRGRSVSTFEDLQKTAADRVSAQESKAKRDMDVISWVLETQTEPAGVKHLLDQHFSRNSNTALESAVKEWAKTHSNKALRDGVEEYFANKTAEHSRNREFVKKLISREAEKVGEAVQRDLHNILERLDERVLRRQISTEQVEATLSNVRKLADNGYSEAAIQVLTQAAEPRGIVQGHHPTCALNTVEYHMYQNFPEVASNVVAQGILNRQFTTWDGNSIRLDSTMLRPEQGSLHHLRDNPNGRSYASQVFQMIAANSFWQVESQSRDASLRKGSVKYTFTDDPLSGRQMRDTIEVTDSTGTTRHLPDELGFTGAEARTISRQLGAPEPLKYVPKLQSFNEMMDWLRGIKHTDYPLFMAVDSGALQIGRNQRAPRSRDHAIVILEVQENVIPPFVRFLDNWNQHGPSSTGSRMMSFEDLWNHLNAH